VYICICSVLLVNNHGVKADGRGGYRRCSKKFSAKRRILFELL
jgi:hypothetical protein